ncbi:MAG: hypothetical protein KAG34_09750 [Cocleimonas sp.]|nr:hypothetical protein [Cocleimonas sp.]
MQIANPIYDIVFKFLMEDKVSAILLLSSIIGEQIDELDLLPQESTLQLEQHSLTVYRLDFSAKITTEEGHKQVLIEIQKAKLPSDIMRFRRYLGEQYSNKNNQYKNSEEQNIPLPIISIYFLGYPLQNIKAPLIKVNQQYYDLTKQQEITTKETFIESLTHDSYVIQISLLNKDHQSELERLLSIFDQHQHLETDKHILDINENDYPKKYCQLIRRLQRAISEPKIRQTMDVEDEILEDLQNMERVIDKKDKVIAEKNQALALKNKALVEKDQVLELKNRALVEKDQIIAELQKRLSDF